MKYLLLGALLLTLPAAAQESVKLAADGIKPVVVEMQGKSAAELFTKSKQWVNTYFKNPKEVLKAEVENDMIRVDGFCKDCFTMKFLGENDYSFTLEISFKDNKYKYEVAVTKLSDDGRPIYYNYDSFFKKDGSTRAMYEKSVESMEASLNATFNSFKDYQTGKTQSAKSDW